MRKPRPIPHDASDEYCDCQDCTHARGPEIQSDDVRLDHIPDVTECRTLRRRFEREGFYPNVWHINERGNTDLLVLGWNGARILLSWV